MLRLALCTVLMSLSAAAVAPAQQVAKIFFRDRAARPERIADVTGAIVSESINGIKLKPPVGPNRDFLVNDIIEVQYTPPTVLVIPMNQIAKLENDVKKNAGEALRKSIVDLQKEYNAILPTIKDNKSAPIKRQIQYRLAQLQAILAGDVVAQQLQAIEAFNKFRKENANAWETVPAAREQVQLLIGVNKLPEAAIVLDETAKTPELAKEIKQDLELMLIDVMIRAGKTGEVEGRISKALALLPANDPLAARLRIYQLGCQAARGDIEPAVAQLKDLIDKSSDAGLKALAYNTLGDCYSAKAKKKEAMWAYLWVDVVYNQDKVEHVKAVERLARVFKELGDDSHADKYREKMKSLR